MSYDQQILKALLSSETYTSLKGKLRDSLFEDEAREIYQLIKERHEAVPDRNLTTDDLMALWNTYNPVSTRAEVRAMQTFVDNLDSAPPLANDVLNEVVSGLWKRDIGRTIANYGLELSQGNDTALSSLKTLIERTSDSFLPDTFNETTTKDIHQLINLVSDENRFQFNIRTLSDRVYGIGRREFGIVFAAPETGKSAFMVSICAAPDGFCSQGARVLYLGNEEDTRRTMLRAIQAYTGMTKEDIRACPDVAAMKFSAIRENIDMLDIQEWTLDQVDSLIGTKKPDIVILDQADKVNVTGSFAASHERLRELYRRLRELAKKHDCAIIAVSQASAEVQGRTKLSPHQMEGSKVGKFAEADLIIGIGKMDSDGEEDTDNTRYLTIGKNKLSGWHGTIICQMEPKISRYVV